NELPGLHGAANPLTYSLHADAETYFGGEPVLDPITGRAMTYAGVEPVRDLYDPAHPVLRDANGNVLVHAAGEAMLHLSGDPVVHLRSETRLYLGGEAVIDEQRHPV